MSNTYNSDATHRILNKVGNPNADFCNQKAVVVQLPCGEYAVRIRWSMQQGLEFNGAVYSRFSVYGTDELAEANANRQAERINQKGVIELRHWDKVHGVRLEEAGWAPQAVLAPTKGKKSKAA